MRNLCLIACGCLGLGLGLGEPANGESFEDWLQGEEKVAIHNLMDSAGRDPEGHAAFVASAASNEPSYNYHWVRDAAGVMRSVLYLYQTSQTSAEKEKYFEIFRDYLAFSRKIQEQPNPSGGVGEPKFNPDGSPYLGSWARPQSDGPASRAIVLLSWAQVLMQNGHFDMVRSLLYDSKLPTSSVIKTDLEYISNNWRTPSFDLWEETKGDHFYTRMMERRALLDGAKLAVTLGDTKAAEWYSRQARDMEADLALFWSPEKKIFVATRNRVVGPLARDSGLDSSVVLGVLLGKTADGFIEFDDERVLSTVNTLERTFKALYPINQVPQIPGIAMGRYPEDRYDGYSSFGLGNPWVPMTATFAQFYSRLALQLTHNGGVEISNLSKDFYDDALVLAGASPLAVGSYAAGTREFDRLINALQSKGDAFLRRIAYHTGPDGNLSEQMNRDTGFMQGAQHLAVSYATYLWALWARHGDFPNPQLPSNP